MSHVFEVNDKTGRKIHLSEERWKHILRHNDVNITHLEYIKSTLVSPDSIISQSFDENKSNYYLYDKQMKSYLLVAVKYLNGEGFITTAFFTKHILKK